MNCSKICDRIVINYVVCLNCLFLRLRLHLCLKKQILLNSNLSDYALPCTAKLPFFILQISWATQSIQITKLPP